MKKQCYEHFKYWVTNFFPDSTTIIGQTYSHHQGQWDQSQYIQGQWQQTPDGNFVWVDGNQEQNVAVVQQQDTEVQPQGTEFQQQDPAAQQQGTVWQQPGYCYF